MSEVAHPHPHRAPAPQRRTAAHLTGRAGEDSEVNGSSRSSALRCSVSAPSSRGHRKAHSPETHSRSCCRGSSPVSTTTPWPTTRSSLTDSSSSDSLSPSLSPLWPCSVAAADPPWSLPVCSPAPSVAPISPTSRRDSQMPTKASQPAIRRPRSGSGCTSLWLVRSSHSLRHSSSPNHLALPRQERRRQPLAAVTKLSRNISSHHRLMGNRPRPSSNIRRLSLPLSNRCLHEHRHLLRPNRGRADSGGTTEAVRHRGASQSTRSAQGAVTCGSIKSMRPRKATRCHLPYSVRRRLPLQGR